MKKLSKIIGLVTLTLIITSCSVREKVKPVGKWDDNIKLSTKNVEFDANQNSITVMTEGNWWWVTDVSVNGEVFNIPENINVLSESYIIKQDCFIVQRKDKNTLYIEIKKNQSNTIRIIKVGLQAGNYFDSIIVTQSAE